MENLNSTTAAATAVQNPSKSELHMVKVNKTKRNQLQRTEVEADRVSSHPLTAVEQDHHFLRNTAQPRILNDTCIGRKNI